MDYQRLLGVTELARTTNQGHGIRIAILDSGTPHLFLHGGYISKSSQYGEAGRDRFGHASEVASILFGCTDINGVCPGAEPYYVKVLDDHGNGSVKSVVKGIQQAIAWQADLINLSLGFVRTDVCPKTLEKACKQAYDAGISVLCAAGNDGEKVNWPAALPTTLCIGASDAEGLKAAFSSCGEVDFLAPGVDLSARDACGVMQHVSGTSFATALATGVATLVMADRKQRNESVLPQDIREGLKQLAQDVGPQGWDEASGYGVLTGSTRDATVEQKMELGFFDKIVGKIQGLFGLGKKGVQHGSV